MEYYKTLLESLGHDCSSNDWIEATASQTVETSQVGLPQPATPWYHEEAVFTTDYKLEQCYKGNTRSKSTYKHITHFKEVLRRVFCERIEKTIPPWLLSRASQQRDFDWRSPNMVRQCRQWMRREKIPRLYYHVIFHLAKRCGGHVNTLPERVEYEWLSIVPAICQQLSSDKASTQKPKKYTPRYYVLLKMLMQSYNVHSHYKMPEIEQEGRQALEEKRVAAAIAKQRENLLYRSTELNDWLKTLL